MFRFLITSIIFVLFTACSENKLELINSIQPYEFEFYSSFFLKLNSDTLASFRNIYNSQLIINDFTIGYSDSTLLMNALKSMNISENSIIEDFLKKNTKSYSLNMINEKFPHCHFINTDIQAQINSDKNKKWITFFELFPNAIGLATISRIGFNNNQTLALLRIDLKFGQTWGENLYFVFTKKDNNWISINKFVVNWEN